MNIVELRDLGITITLTKSGKLHLEARRGLLTPVLRELITRSRDYLVQELVRFDESVNMGELGELGELHSLMFEPETTSYAPASEVRPEPSISPADWHELAAAYHAHHFNCVTCQAAGRGKQYGLRCGTGSALWTLTKTPIQSEISGRNQT